MISPLDVATAFHSKMNAWELESHMFDELESRKEEKERLDHEKCKEILISRLNTLFSNYTSVLFDVNDQLSYGLPPSYSLDGFTAKLEIETKSMAVVSVCFTDRSKSKRKINLHLKLKGSKWVIESRKEVKGDKEFALSLKDLYF